MTLIYKKILKPIVVDSFEINHDKVSLTKPVDLSERFVKKQAKPIFDTQRYGYQQIHEEIAYNNSAQIVRDSYENIGYTPVSRGIESRSFTGLKSNGITKSFQSFQTPSKSLKIDTRMDIDSRYSNSNISEPLSNKQEISPSNSIYSRHMLLASSPESYESNFIQKKRGSTQDNSSRKKSKNEVSPFNPGVKRGSTQDNSSRKKSKNEVSPKPGIAPIHQKKIKERY